MQPNSFIPGSYVFKFISEIQIFHCPTLVTNKFNTFFIHNQAKILLSFFLCQQALVATCFFQVTKIVTYQSFNCNKKTSF